MKKSAQWITSFEALMVGMIILYLYHFVECQSLFEKFLPLEGFVGVLASVMISIVVVFSLLLFSCHFEGENSDKRVSLMIRIVILLFSLVINCYYWNVFSYTTSDKIDMSASLVLVFKVIISIFMACFDVVFNLIFLEKWSKISLEREQSQAVSSVEQTLIERQQALSQLEQEVSEEQAKLGQLRATQDSRTCLYCLERLPTVNARNAHMRTCNERVI